MAPCVSLYNIQFFFIKVSLRFDDNFGMKINATLATTLAYFKLSYFSSYKTFIVSERASVRAFVNMNLFIFNFNSAFIIILNEMLDL